MSIQKIMAFAKAYETYNMLGPAFEYRQRAAKALVDAFTELTRPIHVLIKYDGGAYQMYRDILLVLPYSGPARKHIEDALLELAVPLADSIVALNTEPEPTVMAADGATS